MISDYPAFPLPLGDELVHESRTGITIRDYFAAKAMSAYILDEALSKDSDNSEDWMQCIADTSYCMADFMIKARGNK